MARQLLANIGWQDVKGATLADLILAKWSTKPQRAKKFSINTSNFSILVIRKFEVKYRQNYITFFLFYFTFIFNICLIFMNYVCKRKIVFLSCVYLRRCLVVGLLLRCVPHFLISLTVDDLSHYYV